MSLKIYLREKPLKELQNDAHFCALGKGDGGESAPCAKGIPSIEKKHQDGKKPFLNKAEKKADEIQ